MSRALLPVGSMPLLGVTFAKKHKTCSRAHTAKLGTDVNCVAGFRPAVYSFPFGASVFSKANEFAHNGAAGIDFLLFPFANISAAQ